MLKRVMRSISRFNKEEIARNSKQLVQDAAAEKIRASHLFDESWYLDRYRDVAAAGEGSDKALHRIRRRRGTRPEPVVRHDLVHQRKLRCRLGWHQSVASLHRRRQGRRPGPDASQRGSEVRGLRQGHQERPARWNADLPADQPDLFRARAPARPGGGTPAVAAGGTVVAHRIADLGRVRDHWPGNEKNNSTVPSTRFFLRWREMSGLRLRRRACHQAFRRRGADGRILGLRHR